METGETGETLFFIAIGIRGLACEKKTQNSGNFQKVLLFCTLSQNGNDGSGFPLFPVSPFPLFRFCPLCERLVPRTPHLPRDAILCDAAWCSPSPRFPFCP